MALSLLILQQQQVYVLRCLCELGQPQWVRGAAISRLTPATLQNRLLLLLRSLLAQHPLASRAISEFLLHVTAVDVHRYLIPRLKELDLIQLDRKG